MGKGTPDPIDEFVEWQDHQYDPGYWASRFPPSWTRKPLRKRRHRVLRNIMAVVSICGSTIGVVGLLGTMEDGLDPAVVIPSVFMPILIVLCAWNVLVSIHEEREYDARRRKG
jgi:hypothetical protein